MLVRMRDADPEVAGLRDPKQHFWIGLTIGVTGRLQEAQQGLQTTLAEQYLALMTKMHAQCKQQVHTAYTVQTSVSAATSLLPHLAAPPSSQPCNCIVSANYLLSLCGHFAGAAPHLFRSQRKPVPTAFASSVVAS